MSLLKDIKSDPFLPKEIRDPIASFLKTTLQNLNSINKDQLEEYKKLLIRSKSISQEELESAHLWVANQINSERTKKGCSEFQIGDHMDKIRLEIQKYFESFNPLA
jgi:hypothetical protein